MAVVVGRLRAGGRHRAPGMGGGEASRGWHGSDGVEEEEEAEGNTDGRDRARARLGGGVGSRRGLLRCAAVWVCDGGGGWVAASTVVYVAGPGAPGHLPVCVAYGHLALSKLNNYLPVSASVCQDHMPLFT